MQNFGQTFLYKTSQTKVLHFVEQCSIAQVLVLRMSYGSINSTGPKGRNDGSSAVHEVSVNLSLDITAVGHDIIEDLPHHKNDEPLSSAFQ